MIFEDRLIVTPLDSPNALSIELATGRVLQKQPSRSLGRFMLGIHGSHLVFCDRNSLTRVSARNIRWRVAERSFRQVRGPLDRRWPRVESSSRPTRVYTGGGSRRISRPSS